MGHPSKDATLYTGQSSKVQMNEFVDTFSDSRNEIVEMRQTGHLIVVSNPTDFEMKDEESSVEAKE
jgi:hypothetical protein